MQLEYAHVSTLVVMCACTLVCVSSCKCTCIHTCTSTYMLGRDLGVRVNSVFQIVFCQGTSVDSLKYTCMFVLDVLFTNMFVKEPYICIHMYLYSNRLYTYQCVSAHEISGGSLRIVNMSAADFCTRALNMQKNSMRVYSRDMYLAVSSYFLRNVYINTCVYISTYRCIYNIHIYIYI